MKLRPILLDLCQLPTQKSRHSHENALTPFASKLEHPPRRRWSSPKANEFGWLRRPLAPERHDKMSGVGVRFRSGRWASIGKFLLAEAATRTTNLKFGKGRNAFFGHSFGSSLISSSRSKPQRRFTSGHRPGHILAGRQPDRKRIADLLSAGRLLVQDPARRHRQGASFCPNLDGCPSAELKQMALPCRGN